MDYCVVVHPSVLSGSPFIIATGLVGALEKKFGVSATEEGTGQLLIILFMLTSLFIFVFSFLFLHPSYILLMIDYTVVLVFLFFLIFIYW